jgi:hypothetical protein
MIEPQRDLHNAQNPGVLVSDPASSVFKSTFLSRNVSGSPRAGFGLRSRLPGQYATDHKSRLPYNKAMRVLPAGITA